MHWLIQSSGLRRSDDVIEFVLNGLKRVGAKFTDFGVIPFTNEITNWQNFPNMPVFVHCSTKALRVLTDESIPSTEIFVGADFSHAEKLRQNLLAGIFYDQKKFDQTQYIKTLGQVLLNDRAEIHQIAELLDMSFTEDKFVKPGKDLKLFSGGILPANTTFREYVESIQRDHFFNESLDDLALVSKPVNILAEWRFFVVHQEVVTGSQYKWHDQVIPSQRIPGYVYAAAERMARLYEPAEAFTMDLAMTENLDLKIVEYNCINASGLYKADVGELAWALRSA